VIEPARLPEVLQASVVRHTGWPPFWYPTRAGIEPYLFDGLVECWLGGDPQTQLANRDPALSDFWRISPEGVAFLLRGYDEDSIAVQRPHQPIAEPGTLFDITVPVWRVGETMLHAASLARNLVEGPATISFVAQYEGLAGRGLTSISEDRPHLGTPSGPGGIANPLEVIEQITYLLFIRGLDDLQIRRKTRPTALGKPIERRIFPEGDDPKGRALRRPALVALQALGAPRCSHRVRARLPLHPRKGGDGSTLCPPHEGRPLHHPHAGLLAKVVDMLDDIPMEDRDTKGDLYEYMLGEDRQRRAERPVPHPAPHHPADGGDDGAGPEGRDLRPGRRHLRLPGGGGRISARQPPGDLPRRGAARALPRGHVPRLRLRFAPCCASAA
jgi:hypothetical protein